MSKSLLPVVLLLMFIDSSGRCQDQLRAVTLQGDTVRLIPKGRDPLLIILTSPGSCHGCLEEIGEVVERTGSHGRVVLLIRSGDDQENKRELYNQWHRTFSDSVTYLFDIQVGMDQYSTTEPLDGIFGKFHARNTPSILVLSGDTQHYYPYITLFTSNGLTIEGLRTITEALSGPSPKK